MTTAPKLNALMLKRSLLTSAAFASASLAAVPSQAASCSPATITANGNGGSDISVSGQTITSQCQLDENDTLTISSSGAVDVTGNTSVYVNDSGAVITNHGTIRTTSNTAESGISVNSAGSVFITNAGNIEILNSGYALFSAGTVDSFINSGTIDTSTADQALYFDTATLSKFSNTGTITANNNALYATASKIGSVDNSSGGSLSSAVASALSFTKSSVSSITNGKGSTMSAAGGGSVIELQNASTLSSLTNSGTISVSGGGYNIRNQNSTITSLINNGTMTATGNSNIYNAFSTIGSFSNTGTMTANGGLNLDNNTSTISSFDNTGTMTAIGDYSLLNDGTITSFNNLGTMSSTVDTIGGTGNIGKFNNAGTINSQNGNALYVNGGIIGSLTNSGTISSDTGGVAIYNSGIITALNNSGTISAGGSDAIYVDGTIGTFTNTGTITAHGAAVYNSGTISNFSNAGKLTSTNADALVLDTPVTFTNTGTITGAAQGIAAYDTANITNSGTINGGISFSSTNDSLTLSGGVVNGGITMGGGSDTITINGNVTTGGTISTNADSGTALSVTNDSTFTVNHSVNVRNGLFVVNDGSTLHLSGGDVTTTNIFSNDGTTRIGTGRTFTANSFDSALAGNLVFDVAGTAGSMSTGLLNVNGTSSSANLTNQVLSLNFTGGVLNSGASSRIAMSSDTAVLPSSVSDNSYLYDFGLELRNGGHDIYAVLTDTRSLSSAANTPNNQRTAEQLMNDLGGSSDPRIQQLITSLTTASTAEEFNRILESTQATLDNGNQAASDAMTGHMFDLADSQLSEVVSGAGGMSSGDEGKGLHAWLQGFGGAFNAGMRGGISGYDADTAGFAVGADTRNLHSNTVLGLSLGYGRSNVDSRNANQTNTNVNSYQLMAYGNHDLGNRTFITGMASFGWNTNDQTRYNVGGTPGLEANADYNSWAGNLRGGVGRNYAVSGQSLVLTPQLFSEYSHFNRDAYTETGAGGANLHVTDSNRDVLNLGTSLQAQWSFKTAGGALIKPDLHASYRYDVLGDSADTSASFAAGGTGFALVGPQQARSTMGVGAGLDLYQANGWDFRANYDYTYRDEYAAHTGLLRAAYQF